MALKKWNTNFRLEDSIRKNRTTLSDEFRCSRKFSAGMTQKGMCHLLFDQIFRRKLLVNGKQPLEIGNWKLEISVKCPSMKKVFHLKGVPSFLSLSGTDRAAR